MTEFTVRLANRPGMLASLAEALASDGINIEALAAYGVNEEGIVRLIVDNAEATRRVLARVGVSATELEVLTTLLPHEPGTLAQMARQLADSGVNIEAMYLLNSHADGLEFAVAIDESDHQKLAS